MLDTNLVVEDTLDKNLEDLISIEPDNDQALIEELEIYPLTLDQLSHVDDVDEEVVGYEDLNQTNDVGLQDNGIMQILEQEFSVPINQSLTVHRFFSPNYQIHYYTNSIEETEYLINEDRDDFNYEGHVFGSLDNQIYDTEDVYYFYNVQTNGQFLTINDDERDLVLETIPDFQFSHVIFQASSTNDNNDLDAVYRFFNTNNNTHFYTSSEAERDFVIDNNPEYVSEGVAFYLDNIIG